MTELLHKALTQSIIGVYYDVYNGTARIYPEYFYDRAMVYDLRALKIRCVQQPEYAIVYKEKIVGKQILDILIAKEVVVEDKVAPCLTRLHKAQLLSYLKVTGRQVGFLFNFGGPKPEFQRLYLAPREPKVGKAQVERAINNHDRSDLIAPETVYEVMVFPVAIQSIADLNLDALREWLRAENAPLGIVANFWDIELKPIYLKPNPS